MARIVFFILNYVRKWSGVKSGKDPVGCRKYRRGKRDRYGVSKKYLKIGIVFPVVSSYICSVKWGKSIINRRKVA